VTASLRRARGGALGAWSALPPVAPRAGSTAWISVALLALVVGLLPGSAEARAVLRADKARAIQELIADVGWATPLDGGYHIDQITIDVDTVTYGLRRIADGDDGPVLGTLVLNPADDGGGDSASFSLAVTVAADDPIVAAHLAAARASVIARDEGDLYTYASTDNAASTGSGEAGAAIATTLGGDLRDVNTKREQLRFPLAILVVLGVLVGVRRRRGAFTFGRRFKQTHLLPVAIQISIYTYWGLYWEGVRGHLPDLLLQLAFGFSFDMLWSLWRRGRWEASFAPLPVVLSANLFVWFDGADQWLGYLVVAMALASKSLRRADGTHIFNPSAAGLFVGGALCLTLPQWFGYQDIAPALAVPPNMIEVIVLAVLIAQVRVPIALVTVGAALMLNTMESVTGQVLLSPYYPPVLIIITALATDPATIPKTGAGRLLYGLVLGVAIHLAGIWFTWWVGMDFWAKVMPIPLVNAAVPWFDRVGRRAPEVAERWLSPPKNALHIAAWALVVAWGLWVIEVKWGVFDPQTHAELGTRHLVVDDGEVSREANPLFTEPFSVRREWEAWRGE